MTVECDFINLSSVVIYYKLANFVVVMCPLKYGLVGDFCVEWCD